MANKGTKKSTKKSKKKGTHHVVPNKDCGWDVKKGGGKKASHHKDTKAEAKKLQEKSVKIKELS